MISSALLLPLLYILPGYAIVGYLYPRRGITDRLILSIGLSIILNITFGVLLASFKVLSEATILLADIIFLLVVTLYHVRETGAQIILFAIAQ
jgi:uncharacterized membrane protein